MENPLEGENIRFDMKTSEDQVRLEAYLDQKKIIYEKRALNDQYISYRIHHSQFKEEEPAWKKAITSQLTARDEVSHRFFESEAGQTFKQKAAEQAKALAIKEQARVKVKRIDPKAGACDIEVQTWLSTRKDGVDGYTMQSVKPCFDFVEQVGFNMEVRYKEGKLVIGSIENYLSNTGHTLNTSGAILAAVSKKGKNPLPITQIIHGAVINSKMLAFMPQDGFSRSLTKDEVSGLLDEGGNNVSLSFSILSKAWEVTKDELLETVSVTLQQPLKIVMTFDKANLEEKREQDILDHDMGASRPN